MADKKITDLSSLSSADATDILPIVDVSANTTKKVAVDGLAAAVAMSLPDGSITPKNLSAGAGSSWGSQSWSPTVTGYGTVITSSYRFMRIGKYVKCFISVTGNPNATSMQFSLPVAAATTSLYFEGQGGLANDNGTTVVPRWSINPTTDPNVVVFFTSVVGGSWSSSGYRELRAIIEYEAA